MHNENITYDYKQIKHLLKFKCILKGVFADIIKQTVHLYSYSDFPIYSNFLR
jgi:hypothetical protein